MSMNEPISVQEALIYVMVIVSASDNQMTDNELATIGDMIKMLPVFNGYDGNRIIPAAQRCGDILQEDNGLQLVLELVGDVLPAKLPLPQSSAVRLPVTGPSDPLGAGI